MNKIFVVYDCEKDTCDKSWLTHVTREFGNARNMETVSLYTKMRLSRLFQSKSIIKRIFARILIIEVIIKLALQSSKNDIIIFWSPLMLQCYFMITRNRICRKIVSMGWLTPRYSRYDKIRKKIMKSKNIIVIAKNKFDRLAIEQYYNPKNNVHIFPDVLDEMDGWEKPIFLARLSNKRYIFMGGRSNRDWDLFIKITRRLPNIQFVGVASSRDWNDEMKNSLLENTKIYFDLTVEEYNKLSRESFISLFLLKENTTSGLINIIQSVQWGKICLATKLDSTKKYFVSEMDGQLLDRNDEYKICDTINYYWNIDEEEYINLVYNHQEYIKSNFTSKLFINLLNEFEWPDYKK